MLASYYNTPSSQPFVCSQYNKLTYAFYIISAIIAYQS